MVDGLMNCTLCKSDKRTKFVRIIRFAKPNQLIWMCKKCQGEQIPILDKAIEMQEYMPKSASIQMATIQDRLIKLAGDDIDLEPLQHEIETAVREIPEHTGKMHFDNYYKMVNGKMKSIHPHGICMKCKNAKAEYDAAGGHGLKRMFLCRECRIGVQT